MYFNVISDGDGDGGCSSRVVVKNKKIPNKRYFIELENQYFDVSIVRELSKSDCDSEIVKDDPDRECYWLCIKFFGGYDTKTYTFRKNKEERDKLYNKLKRILKNIQKELNK
jgi:hypothetical protein